MFQQLQQPHLYMLLSCETSSYISAAAAAVMHCCLLLLLLLLLQSWLNFDAHTGTHIDAPAHFLKGGSTVEDLDLDVLIGEQTLRVGYIMCTGTTCNYFFLDSSKVGY
jgi:hypothetical protein